MAKKSRSLKGIVARREFKEALTKYEEAMVEEEAIRELTTGVLTSQKPKTPFKHLDLYKIEKEGIVREGKRITGIEAVKIQAESLKRYADKELQKQEYIENYKQAMIKNNIPFEQRKQVIKELDKFTPQEISFAIRNNAIPNIYTIYTGKKADMIEKEIRENTEGIKQGVKQIDFQKAQALVSNIIERWKILG